MITTDRTVLIMPKVRIETLLLQRLSSKPFPVSCAIMRILAFVLESCVTNTPATRFGPPKKRRLHC